MGEGGYVMPQAILGNLETPSEVPRLDGRVRCYFQRRIQHVHLRGEWTVAFLEHRGWRQLACKYIHACYLYPNVLIRLCYLPGKRQPCRRVSVGALPRARSSSPGIQSPAPLLFRSYSLQRCRVFLPSWYRGAGVGVGLHLQLLGSSAV